MTDIDTQAALTTVTATASSLLPEFSFVCIAARGEELIFGGNITDLELFSVTKEFVDHYSVEILPRSIALSRADGTAVKIGLSEEAAQQLLDADLVCTCSDDAHDHDLHLNPEADLEVEGRVELLVLAAVGLL